MQCSNCRFENMPGVQACGRCGASLRLAALAIDVHPPRAGKLRKFQRRWLPLNFNDLRRFAGAAVDGLFAREVSERDAAPVLWRTVIPGWPQMYQGHAARGCWFLLTFLGCGIAGVLLLGHSASTTLLGLAGAIHAASVVDVVLPATRRLVYTLGCCLAITGAIYLPAVWVVSGVAAPRTILLEMGHFQRGDVVLVNRWTYAIRRPRPGDVALYALPRMRVPFNALYGMPGQAAQYQIEGEQIDRVVAAPGQRVVIQQGTLLVDGREAVDRPLDHVQWPSRLDLLVPPGHFFVVPSALRLDWERISDVDKVTILFVPEDLLLGKVCLRNYPLWRFSWIR